MKTLSAAALALALSTLSSIADPLPILLKLDISNPANVTISSTENPAADYVVGYFNDGIFLQGFLNESFTDQTSSNVSGSLTPTYGEGVLLADAKISGYDLNLFNASESSESNFFVNAIFPAFEGSSTVDLSTYSSFFTSTGGDILLDGSVIGAYEVIPEPSTIAFGFIGMVGLAIAARRNRK